VRREVIVFERWASLIRTAPLIWRQRLVVMRTNGTVGNTGTAVYANIKPGSVVVKSPFAKIHQLHLQIKSTRAQNVVWIENFLDYAAEIIGIELV
jgi:hypothetical protein